MTIMWFIQPKQDYVAQLPWKHADEPAVMAWQIRARDYNTFVANLGFFAWLAVGSIFVSFLIIKGGSGREILHPINLVPVIVLLLSAPIAMSIFFQTTIIVYRLTDQRIEVFSWKPQIDSVKPVMTWTAIGSGVVVLFLAFIDPAFLIAAIGPRSEEHTSELQSRPHLVCRLLLEKKNKISLQQILTLYPQS